MYIHIFFLLIPADSFDYIKDIPFKRHTPSQKESARKDEEGETANGLPGAEKRCQQLLV